MTEERKFTCKNFILNADRASYMVDDFLFWVAFFKLFFGWDVIIFYFLSPEKVLFAPDCCGWDMSN